MNNYIVYLSFGSIDYYNETLFSILSFCKYHKNDAVHLLLYTDDVAFFKNKIEFHVTYHEIKVEQLKIWSGSCNFNHRSKIKVLEEVTTKYFGNFMFVDSDTYFVANCTPLFEHINNGAIVLDKCEGKLADIRGGIAKKLRRFLKKENHFSTKSDDSVLFDEQFTMYNTGTIGFNSKYKSILTKVLQLVDVLYPKCSLFIMEQVSFSYYLQRETKPISSEKYIHHYWYFKEFRTVLAAFFEHNKATPFNQFLIECDKINPEQLSTEKRRYKAMTFWQKQFHKITKGRKWKIMDYEL